MSKSVRQLVISAAGLITIIAITVYGYVYFAEHERNRRKAPQGEEWVWTNPITLETATIPATWQAAESGSTGGTEVTLQHWTGRSVVYLVHEQTDDELTLPEYVAARDDVIERELGIEEVESTWGSSRYFQGQGARLLGNEVANTRVRIWRQDPTTFWRAAGISDTEYRELEYDAERIISLLMETTPLTSTR